MFSPPQTAADFHLLLEEAQQIREALVAMRAVLA
jgi:hypothetical protein